METLPGLLKVKSLKIFDRDLYRATPALTLTHDLGILHSAKDLLLRLLGGFGTCGLIINPDPRGSLCLA